MKALISVLLMLVITLGLVCPLLAEEKWTAEQKEILAWEEKFFSLTKPEQLDEALAMLHPSFMQWLYDRPVPEGVKEQRPWWDYGNTVSETILSQFTPLAIQIYGNFAVIHYYYRTVYHIKPKNEDKVSNGRWTDVLVKENGRWLCISAHGGEGPGK